MTDFAYDGGSYTSTTGVGNDTTFRGSTGTFNSDNEITNTGYSYDGNGNPTTYKSTSLTYDPENRLTAYGSLDTYGYNGDGLRAWRHNSSGTFYFLYDGDTLVTELTSTGTIQAANTFGANGLVSRRNNGGSTTFYTFDPSGNVAQRYDSSVTLLSSDVADGFGTIASTSTPVNKYSFGAQWGYYTDSDTGLILCGHRYYDPGVGRWLNRDPIGYDGGINVYGYLENNPTGQIDPDGTVPRSSPIGGPQSLEECRALADAQYERNIQKCRKYLPNKKKFAACAAKAFAQYAADLAECNLQECAKDVKDILNNTVPGTGWPGQPIFGPLPTPGRGGPTILPFPMPIPIPIRW